MNKTYTYIGLGIAVVVLIGVVVWFISPRGVSTPTSSITNNVFDTGSTVSTRTARETGGGNSLPVSNGQIIFKIANGPIAGATFIETTRPTTTLARYIMQESGHVLDLSVDTPGAVSKPVSNTTIPGIIRVVWLEKGNALVAQYVDGVTIKSVYLGFPSATTTATSSAQKPTRILFLPDNIAEIAASLDGKNVAYLLRTGAGTDGYIARSDGSASKKLFSFPLAQTLLSWPSSDTLLLQTKSGVGVPGGVFSVSVQTGAILPLVYADGLTATANPSFSQVLYQTVRTGSSLAFTYVHEVKSGVDNLLPLGVSPERCVWSVVSTSTAYCAAPPQNAPAGYLDLWHIGTNNLSNSIFKVNISKNITTVVATPGGSGGGVASDIGEAALAPSESYLSFITRGGRELWGVRLKP